MFVRQLLSGAALGVAGATRLMAADKLDPAEPYARAMGFRLNTEEVDQAKYPRHTNQQHCQACQLWNGADQDFGNCSFFDQAITPKNGWCKNFKAKSPA